jgi:hypothetical protein
MLMGSDFSSNLVFLDSKRYTTDSKVITDHSFYEVGFFHIQTFSKALLKHIWQNMPTTFFVTGLHSSVANKQTFS